MNTFSNQRGMTIWGWMVVGTMAGVLLITGLKLFPVYMEYFTMKGIVDQVKDDPELKGATKDKILMAMHRRVGLADVKNVNTQDYEVTKIPGKNAYSIDLYYEVRTPLFANLSMVTEFEYSQEVGE
ncbi:MAG TPA: DUF4845 domain-containing protein [Gammaproteobacteria bacterium]|nr:DUF4845 domain-containing protein [Gammaproteobacteria bacterium]